ncbi:MAG: nucleoside monophosphate kinase, partial [Hungatella sp.]
KTEGICDICGETLVLRVDDQPKTVQKRLRVYHEQTQPLIEYYRKAKILMEVDGTQNVDDVFQSILHILGV